MAPETFLPAWAAWSPEAAARPWTVGVEEELVLLDPVTGLVVNRIDDVLGALPPQLASRASAETHACVVELKTAPHATVAGAASELAALRRAVDLVVRSELGLRAAAAGMHPLATPSEATVSSSAHFRKIDATLRALAHREPTMALHVHVAVPDAATAVRALDGLRADLPLVLAVSANSPFWRARDSGFDSMRTPIFSMFPRAGIPRRFRVYSTYVRLVEDMIASGLIPDPGFIWWDARLQPRFGTIEVRIADAQSRVGDVAALAALVQCLVLDHATAFRPGDVDAEILAENRFLAARDGLRASLVEGGSGRRRPAEDILGAVVQRCRPLAAALQCVAELDAVERLAGDPGATRQRRLAASAGVGAVPGLLAAEFAPAAEGVALAAVGPLPPPVPHPLPGGPHRAP